MKNDNIKFNKFWLKDELLEDSANLPDLGVIVAEIIEDLEVQPNHAWRHTFRTTAREAGMDTPCVDYIVSHARKTEGDKYGDWTIKANAMQMAKFPRYQLRKDSSSDEP